ncbi:MAG: SRPBCC domain-containing protein [Chitinophagales bacterium]
MYSINQKSIVKTKVLNTSAKQLWKKWTTHEGLLTFFGRDNKIELIPGGAFEIYFLMENEYGLRGSETCKVLSYLPNEMLSFSWNAPPSFLKIRNHPHKTWVVITFKPINENQCEVKLTHLGWLDGDEWNKVFEYFENAWEIVLNRFEESIK